MSEHDRKPESEPQFLTGHDEPVVVDNGPATVMFGTKHEPTGSNGGKTWTRRGRQLLRAVRAGRSRERPGHLR